MRSIKAALATIIVPGLACFLVPYSILRATHVSLALSMDVFQGIAVVAAAIGASMIVWVSAAFVRVGKGTPVPIEPPKHLVRTGLYCYVRNPMYVGALLIILAEAIYFRSLPLVLYAAGLWIILHTFIVVFEEPQLKRRFGLPYEQYLQEVPRWIPRLQRSSE